MKRANHLIELIADMDNLRLAFWKAQKGKSYFDKVVAYRKDLEVNLQNLRSQILCGEVEVGDYYYFKIFDPKERLICASAFGERVLHHGLMNVCHPYFENYQIFDSYASRPNMGLHKALDRAKKFTKSNNWFLKLDVKSFFGSIHHEVLKEQLKRRFKEHKLLAIFYQIIDSYETSSGMGLPIGNLGSQYFANHYLAVLDHYIKEDLGCKYYIRYMDDMVVWHGNKQTLKQIHQSIDNFVENELRCSLKPILLNRVDRGLPFCGYLIRPNRIRLSQRSKRRYIKKIQLLEDNFRTGVWTAEECQRKALPLIAFTKYADAVNFRKRVLYKNFGQLP